MATMAGEVEPLTVRAAVQAIEQAQGYEAPLRRRTEGATWMVWGLVIAGMNLSYGLSYAMGWSHTWMSVAWLAAGLGMSAAVWRIAALTLPVIHPGRRAASVALAIVVGTALGLWVLLEALGLAPGRLTVSGFVAIGAIWLLLAGLNPHQATDLGRRTMAGIGVAIILGGLGFAAWMPVAPVANWPLGSAVAAIIGGVPPFLGGLWQVLRG